MSGFQPVQPQNCSLNLNADSKKAREIKAPQQSKLTPAPTIPRHASHAALTPC